MQKLKVLKITNAVLFFTAVTQAATGLFLFFVAQGPWVETVGEVHRFTGLLLGVLIVTHLYLNWTVIKNHYFTKTVKAAS